MFHTKERSHPARGRPEPPSTLRIDRWLWAARFFKTRSSAAAAVAGGKVHLNGQRTKPAKGVRAGDRLDVRRGDLRWEITVLGTAERRGPASEARTLYEDKEGMVGYGTLGAVLDTLEHALAGGGYVAGERFSAADVYVGSHVGWGLRLGSIEKRDAFSGYWSRLSGREALRRANEIDDALRAGSSGG